MLKKKIQRFIDKEERNMGNTYIFVLLSITSWLNLYNKIDFTFIHKKYKANTTVLSSVRPSTCLSSGSGRKIL